MSYDQTSTAAAAAAMWNHRWSQFSTQIDLTKTTSIWCQNEFHWLLQNIHLVEMGKLVPSNLYDEIFGFLQIMRRKDQLRDLFYRLVLVLYAFFPLLTTYLLRILIEPIGARRLPVGSWKDMKWLCYYAGEKHPMVDTILTMMNRQLWLDSQHVSSFQGPQGRVSLVAKWIPKEKQKKFGWIFLKLFQHWKRNYNPFMTVSGYRRLISSLRSKTVERALCEGSSTEIHNITLGAMLTHHDVILPGAAGAGAAGAGAAGAGAAATKTTLIHPFTLLRNAHRFCVPPRWLASRAARGKSPSAFMESILSQKIKEQWILPSQDTLVLLDTSWDTCYLEQKYEAIGWTAAFRPSRILTVCQHPQWIHINDSSATTTSYHSLLCEFNQSIQGSESRSVVFPALNFLMDALFIYTQTVHEVEPLTFLFISRGHFEDITHPGENIGEIMQRCCQEYGFGFLVNHTYPFPETKVVSRITLTYPPPRGYLNNFL